MIKRLRVQIPGLSTAIARKPRAVSDESGPDLNPVTYRLLYPDLIGLDEVDLRKHWLRYGHAENRISNADGLPADFNAMSYYYLNRDLAIDAHPAAWAARHYLSFGLKEGRTYSISRKDAVFIEAYARTHGPDEVADRRFAWTPSAVVAFLHVFGLDSDAFLARFDFEFYSSLFMDAEDKHDYYSSLIHFVENGVEHLSPIAADLLFDIGFHRRQLRLLGSPDLPLDDASLYRLWLTTFDLVKYSPNHASSMEMRFGGAFSPDDIVDPEIYRLANADLAHLDDFTLLDHILEHGIFEQRSSIRITMTNAPLLVQYARRLEAQGEHEKTYMLYERLLHFQPAMAMLYDHFADYLTRREQFATAFRLCKHNIAAGLAGKRTFFNAAQCCDKLNDLGQLIEVLTAACQAFPDDEALSRHRHRAADRYFDDESAFATVTALSGRVADGQAVLATASQRYDLSVCSRAPNRPVRSIGLYANLDLPQCTLYRVEQRIEQLNHAGLKVYLYDWRHDRAAFHGEMADLDAIIFYRVAALPDVLRAIRAAQAAGLVTFYEIDDLLFDPEMFPEPLPDYAGQITAEQHVELSLGVPLFRKAIEACDYAIASTPTLARYMQPLTKCRRSFVHRNALGQRHEIAMMAHREPASSADRPVTIFYGSGTRAHKLDFERILLPALEAIDRRFGNKVRLVIAGYPPLDLGKGVLARAQFQPFTTEIETYWALLREADIALSVLRRTSTTSAKSEIKWLEAAMFGVPSVVSATDTFEEVIEDGVDGYLATDTKTFIDKVSALVRDPKQRRAMGEAARQKVLRDYGVDPQAANLLAMFEAVVAPTNERKRVLIVNVFYAPQAKGGATRVVIDNIRDIAALYPNEFEVEVFATLEGGESPYSVRVTSYEGVRVTTMVAGNLPLGDGTAEDVPAGEAFERCVDRFKPHLIHFHCIQRITASAVQVAQRLAVPYFITAHDGWWISDRQFLRDEQGPAPIYEFGTSTPLKAGPRGRNARPATLFSALAGAKAVLAVSDPFAELYRSTGLHNVLSVPNGISSQMRTPPRRGGRPASSKVTLAHIGGLEEHKGFSLLRDAIVATRPRNVTLLAVDLSLERGDEVVEKLGTTTVRFIGRHRQDEMADLYRDIDVLFAPSLWPESFGLVTREAAASGCWVVASDRGAVGAAVQDGVNGHIVSVDNLRGLIAVIEAIDADPAKYLRSPPPTPLMRTSQDQARELAALYREAIATASTSTDDVATQSFCR